MYWLLAVLAVSQSGGTIGQGGSRWVTGTLLRLEDGDYIRPVVLGQEGDTLTLWLFDERGMDLFLALNVGSRMDFEIETREVWIPELGGRNCVDLLLAARSNGLGFEDWLAGQPGDLDLESLYDIYYDQYMQAVNH